jgi:hypothetical protein
MDIVYYSNIKTNNSLKDTYSAQFIYQKFMDSKALVGVVEYALRKGEESVNEIIRLLQQQQLLVKQESSKGTMSNSTVSSKVSFKSLTQTISRVIPVFHACLSFLLRCWGSFPLVIETHDDIVNNTLSIIRFFFSLPVSEIFTAAVSRKILWLFEKLLENDDEFAVVLYKFVICSLSSPSSAQSSAVSSSPLFSKLNLDSESLSSISSSIIPDYANGAVPVTSGLNPLSPFVLGITTIIHKYVSLPNSISSSLLSASTPTLSSIPLPTAAITSFSPVYPLVNHYLCFDEILSHFALIISRFLQVSITPIVDIVCRRISSLVISMGDIDIIAAFVRHPSLSEEHAFSLCSVFSKFLLNEDVHRVLDEEWENLKKKRKSDEDKEIRRRKGLLTSDDINESFSSISQSTFPFVSIRTYCYLCVFFTELIYRFHYYPPFKTLISDYIEKGTHLLLSFSSFVTALLKTQPQLPSSVFSGDVKDSSSLPFLMSIAKSSSEKDEDTESDDVEDNWLSPSSSRTLINSIIALGCNAGSSSPSSATTASSVPQESSLIPTTATSSVSLPSTCVGIYVLRSLLIFADKSRDVLLSY